MNIVFMGGKQAGCIGLLTIMALGHRVLAVIAYDKKLSELADALQLHWFSSTKQPRVQSLFSDSDLLVSVHGREFISSGMLFLPQLGGINVHPCLYAYKGADPVSRLLQDGNTRASVGVHRMTSKIDEGEVLAEIFVDVAGLKTAVEVYNILYPYYSLALLKALKLTDPEWRELRQEQKG